MNDEEIKVSELDSASEIRDTDQIMIVQGGVNKKVLGEYINEHGVVVSNTTPDAPQNVWFKLGKNLLNPENIVDIGVGKTSAPIVLKVKPNTSYTMSSNVPYSANNAALFFFTSGTTTDGVSTANNGIWSGQTRTFTSDSNGYICYSYRKLQGDTNVNLKDYWYQIEEGSSATTYEAYINPQVRINDREILNKDESQTIYDGNWIIKKYSDNTFEAWYKHTTDPTTTATTAQFGGYSSPTLTLNFPSVITYSMVKHYYLYASFTAAFSQLIFWNYQNSIQYRIIADTSISNAQKYRLSAYLFGTWE